MSSLSADPERRLGVYKRLTDVPPDYRLHQFESEYADRDLWTEFHERECEKYTSTYFREKSERTGRRWKAHMVDRGRHHGFARPDDVGSWLDDLLDGAAVNTVYNNYWTRLAAFYDWLCWSTDHPHRYNPVLMAAVSTDSGRIVWNEKIDCRDP